MDIDLALNPSKKMKERSNNGLFQRMMSCKGPQVFCHLEILALKGWESLDMIPQNVKPPPPPRALKSCPSVMPKAYRY